MKTIKIKTFHMNSSLNFPHFFILSKGYNAGKPLKKPCPNCFIVIAENEEHKYQLFWICYCLWKSGAYLPMLRGSVIPFLSIRDASTVVQRALTAVETRKDEFDRQIKKLSHLTHLEKQLCLQIKLICELKASLVYKVTRTDK